MSRLSDKQLMSVAMTPPLPIVLMQMIASLKDKLPKGFPVKKVLLLVWKVLLACLGGMKEVSKAKNLAREVSGLPTVKKGESAEAACGSRLIW